MVMGAEDFYVSDEIFRHALLDQWLDQGGNAIDTGRIYGIKDGEPQSERVVGRWMATRSNREEVVVVTKCCHPWPDVPKRVAAETMAADVEGSLEALQTEYIDVLLMHRDDPDVPVGEVMGWLNEHREAGRVHAFGASNWSLERYQAANEWAQANGKSGFSLVSNYAGLAEMATPLWPGCRSIDGEWAGWLRESGVANLSWAGLSHGFFSGRFSPENREQEDMVGAFYAEANWARLGTGAGIRGGAGMVGDAGGAGLGAESGFQGAGGVLGGEFRRIQGGIGDGGGGDERGGRGVAGGRGGGGAGLVDQWRSGPAAVRPPSTNMTSPLT